MPVSAFRICTYPGCTNLVRSGRCAKHTQQADRLFPHDPVSQRLYSSKRWKELRAAHLADEPYCREHLRRGERVKATTVDHIEPHKGDEQKFFAGPFQSLCQRCHAIKTNRERYGSIPGGSKKFSRSQIKADLHLIRENIPDRKH